MDLPKQASRSRAVVAGAATGVLLTGGAILGSLAYASAGSAGYREIGVTPLAVVGTAVPVTLVLGALIGLPTAGVLVFSMTWAARRWKMFDLAACWAGAGALVCIPLAWLASEFDMPGRAFALTWLTVSPLAIGALSALAAWSVRPRSGDIRPDAGQR